MVGVAATGRETIDLTAALSPDVVLLDLNLSDPDAFETMRLLRERGLQPKTIALGGAGERRRARELGAVAFVDKPESVGELAATVRAAAALAGALREG